MRRNIFADIQFWSNLKMTRSCHTLSNAFGMSRNTSPMVNWNKQSNISGYEIKTKRKRFARGRNNRAYKGGGGWGSKRQKEFEMCSMLIIRRSTLVEQCPMKSLLSVPLSICPSVAKFSQDWIISFCWYCTWW